MLKDYYSWEQGDRKYHNTPSGEQFSACCGSKYVTTAPRKWKNQYGEGVSEGINIDPVKRNTMGILLVDGIVGTAGKHGKTSVHHVKTKNGDITISIKEVW